MICRNIKNRKNQVKKLSYGKLLFNGVYFYKDKLISKGKIYDDNGGLIFEGEILNGERWNGKEKRI